jgi:Ser/Thr protein kinase RdoA (MazF antagonist)
VLTPASVDTLAGRFGLGAAPRLEGPVARGQLGQVWRLTTSAGSFAVKEWFARPEDERPAMDADFSGRARAAGLCTPAVVRTVDGQVTAVVDDTMVRVFEWVDLLPRTPELDPVRVADALALLHTVGAASDEPVDRWFSGGFGSSAWYALLERLTDELAPFADDFGRLVGALVEVESVIEPHQTTIVCHRDLWADNVLGTPDGRVCVIDFENMGPADPSQELAMVLFEFGDDDPGRMRSLHGHYVEMGGPGRVTRPGHFSMLVAEQAHITHYAGARWIGADDPEERKRLESWFRETLDRPVTLEQIDRLLAGLR